MIGFANLISSYVAASSSIEQCENGRIRMLSASINNMLLYAPLCFLLTTVAGQYNII